MHASAKQKAGWFAKNLFCTLCDFTPPFCAVFRTVFYRFFVNFSLQNNLFSRTSFISVFAPQFALSISSFRVKKALVKSVEHSLV